MARDPETEDKAKQVKSVVDRIYHALLRAHRRLYRTIVRSQHDIGSGRPSAADEAETSLGVRMYTDSYRDLVVLGFWYEGQKGPKYVCSTSGMNMVRAVRKVGPRAMELANSWRAKDRAGVYQDFLREARKIELDVQEIESESRRLVDRHELDMLRLRRQLGVAFQVSEAEARMASYLMRHDVAATVHVYATDSPCGFCGRTYAALGPALEKLKQRQAAVKDNRPERKAGEGTPGLRWRIGWVYYGQLYHAGNPEKTTDLSALDAAVRAGSIAGHAQL
ncbi:MAG: hypothetical protein L0Z62_44575 [Gemmataceae bacterium]|nr:hypothetical protein [Gemmataceae bacterium]